MPKVVDEVELDALLAQGDRYRQSGVVDAEQHNNACDFIAPDGRKVRVPATGWLVKDGDHWFSERDQWFIDFYKPLGGNRYQKTMVVDAVQLSTESEVAVLGELIHVPPGDWVVRSVAHPSRPPQVVDSETFTRCYRKCKQRRSLPGRLSSVMRVLEQRGYIRASVLYPVALALAFTAVFWWGFVTFNETKSEKVVSVAQQAWATLLLFTGSYLSLDPGWDPEPPKNLSRVGILAVSLTLLTAGSLTLLSRRARDFVRVLRPRARLVVIGDNTTAAALVRSSIEHRIRTVLITDSRESAAALATKPSIPIIAAGELQSVLRRPTTRRVIAHASHIVVATDSDAENISLHASISDLREARRYMRKNETQRITSPFKDLVVIHDPRYADTLRPRVIEGRLPDREVTCPAENIAEHVLHLLVAVATGGGPTVRNIEVPVIELPRPTGQSSADQNLRATIETWVCRLTQMLEIVDGKLVHDEDGHLNTEYVPVIIDGNRRDATPDLRVEIIVGAPADVAIAAFAPCDESTIRVVVTDASLVTFAETMRNPDHRRRRRIVDGREWLSAGAPMGGDHRPSVIVVDGRRVGFDAGLVTDDEGTQWARTFDLTYALMYSDGGYAVTGWQPGAPMGESVRRVRAEARSSARDAGIWNGRSIEGRERAALKRISDRYSSMHAVSNMLHLLDSRGYLLMRNGGDDDQAACEIDRDDVEFLAAKEHEHWRTERKWWGRTSCFPPKCEQFDASTFSSSGANEYCFWGLTQSQYWEQERVGRLRFAADYNRRIIRETYPAIAAAFGYRIVRKPNWQPAAVQSPQPCKNCPACTAARVDSPKGSLPNEDVGQGLVEKA